MSTAVSARPAEGATSPATTDVLVIFGISGDLARVMTFRSLYRLERRGLLRCPILGVAVDDWSDDDLRAHARAAIEACGETIDGETFAASRGGCPICPATSPTRGRSSAWPAPWTGRTTPSSTSRSRRRCSGWWSRASPAQG